jgi:hypothetical protein
MIYIGLPFKVVLRSQLKDIAKKMKVPYEELEEVHSYCSYVDPEKKSGSLTIKEQGWQEYGSSIVEEGKTDRDYIGSSGIRTLSITTGVTLNSVSCIYIPGMVWDTLKVTERRDLSKLLYKVEKRVNRYRMLVEIGAPEIITRNEARMLEDNVYALDDNSGKYGLHRVTNEKDKPYISLKDIDFDLSTYRWKDPLYDPEEDDDPIMDIKVPAYVTPEELEAERKIHNKTCDNYDNAMKEIEELKKKVVDLESHLKHEKEKCEKIKEERNRTVHALSKENLVLDHKVDELIEKIQSISVSRV